MSKPININIALHCAETLREELLSYDGGDMWQPFVIEFDELSGDISPAVNKKLADYVLENIQAVKSIGDISASTTDSFFIKLKSALNVGDIDMALNSIGLNAFIFYGHIDPAVRSVVDGNVLLVQNPTYEHTGDSETSMSNWRSLEGEKFRECLAHRAEDGDFVLTSPDVPAVWVGVNIKDKSEQRSNAIPLFLDSLARRGVDVDGVDSVSLTNSDNTLHGRDLSEIERDIIACVSARTVGR